MVERTRRTIFAAYPNLHPIRGGSDAALIATSLSAAPLCAECLAKRTGVPSRRIDDMLAEISTTLKLLIGPSRCLGCLGDQATTYRLATTDGAGATNGAARTQRPGRESLWQFLEQHRGRMFCTACLAGALGATGRIDKLLLAAEGRGALRRHEPCAGCGRARLVCGLSA